MYNELNKKSTQFLSVWLNKGSPPLLIFWLKRVIDWLRGTGCTLRLQFNYYHKRYLCAQIAIAYISIFECSHIACVL